MTGVRLVVYSLLTLITSCIAVIFGFRLRTRLHRVPLFAFVSALIFTPLLLLQSLRNAPFARTTLEHFNCDSGGVITYASTAVAGVSAVLLHFHFLFKARLINTSRKWKVREILYLALITTFLVAIIPIHTESSLIVLPNGLCSAKRPKWGTAALGTLMILMNAFGAMMFAIPLYLLVRGVRPARHYRGGPSAPSPYPRSPRRGNGPSSAHSRSFNSSWPTAWHVLTKPPAGASPDEQMIFFVVRIFVATVFSLLVTIATYSMILLDVFEGSGSFLYFVDVVVSLGCAAWALPLPNRPPSRVEAESITLGSKMP